jgi:hypothetical protein
MEKRKKLTPEVLLRYRTAIQIILFNDFKEGTEEEFIAFDTHRIIGAEQVKNDDERAILAAWNEAASITDDLHMAQFQYAEAKYKAVGLDIRDSRSLEELPPEEQGEWIRKRDELHKLELPVPPKLQALWDKQTDLEHRFISLVLDYYESNGRLPQSLKRENFATDAVTSKTPRLLPLSSETMRFYCNHVTGTAVPAMSRMPWPKSDREGYAFSILEKRKNFKVYYGIKDGPKAETLARICDRGGARMIKAFFALWERWFQEGCHTDGYLTVDISTFCDDMGYVQHVNGGHKPENKRQAFEDLDALTEIQIDAYFTQPGKDGKTVRLSGPLWNRGISAEIKDEHSDLFGYEPRLFSYAPGQWFSVEGFMSYGRSIGMIGAGLRKLHNYNDEWAILIGGYLATIFRADGYKAERNLFAQTIIEKANVGQNPRDLKQASETRKRFEDSLDKLKKVGVISGWHWAGTEVTEPDFDDPDSIAAYAADESMLIKRNEWRRKLITIILPEYLSARAPVIQEGRQKHIAAARRRTASRKKLPQ